MHGNTGWTQQQREEAIEHILTQVASGRAVTRILAEDDNMPASSLFWGKWHRGDEQLQSDLARAREAGVEVHLEEAVEIADEDPEYYATENGQRVDPGDVAHRKNRIETRIKRAQMIAPRKYGPKIDLTSGGDRLPGVDAGDVATRIAGLLATARERKDENG